MENPNIQESVPSVRLVEPSAEYKASFIEATKDFHLEGRDTEVKVENEDFNFDEYIESLDRKSQGLDLKEGQVPESVFWLVDDEGYVGTARLRHYLNEKLLRGGGNIGYQIWIKKRELGYGSKILELALEKARELGLEKVLVTCNKDNAASRRIIEKNGGVMENENEIEGDRGDLITIQRFWIDIK